MFPELHQDEHRDFPKKLLLTQLRFLVRNTTIDLNSNNFETPANMTAWPSFHNGVAAGLRIADSSQACS